MVITIKISCYYHYHWIHYWFALLCGTRLGIDAGMHVRQPPHLLGWALLWQHALQLLRHHKALRCATAIQISGVFMTCPRCTTTPHTPRVPPKSTATAPTPAKGTATASTLAANSAALPAPTAALQHSKSTSEHCHCSSSSNEHHSSTYSHHGHSREHCSYSDSLKEHCRYSSSVKQYCCCSNSHKDHHSNYSSSLSHGTTTPRPHIISLEEVSCTPVSDSTIDRNTALPLAMEWSVLH